MRQKFEEKGIRLKFVQSDFRPGRVYILCHCFFGMPGSKRNAVKAAEPTSEDVDVKKAGEKVVEDEKVVSAVEEASAATNAMDTDAKPDDSAVKTKKRARESDSETSEGEETAPSKKSAKLASSKAASSKKASGKKATASKKTRAVETDDSFESSDEEVKPPRGKAKATSGPASSRPKRAAATRKRYVDLSESESSMSEDESSEEETRPSKPTTTKKSGGKKSTAAKKTDSKAMDVDESASESASSDEAEKPAKATVTKKSSGKKSTSAKKTDAKSKESDESTSESAESDVEEKPAKATGTKKASGKKSTAAKKAEEEEDGEEMAEAEVTDFKTPVLASGELKIVSWNVAGYAAVTKKGFEQYLKDENPDIICLQETKVKGSEGMTFGYHSYFSGCKENAGLHGTAILSKTKPLSVTYRDDSDEGRVTIAEFDKFYIINTYVPNSGRDLDRLQYRLKWDTKLQAIYLELQAKKPVIWCGDLNVAQHPIDLANPGTNVRFSIFNELV